MFNPLDISRHKKFQTLTNFPIHLSNINITNPIDVWIQVSDVNLTGIPLKKEDNLLLKKLGYHFSSVECKSILTWYEVIEGLHYGLIIIRKVKTEETNFVNSYEAIDFLLTLVSSIYDYDINTLTAHLAGITYFKTMGYVVKPALTFGADIFLYEDGPAYCHASKAVVILDNSRIASMKINDIQAKARVTDSASKLLTLCVVSVPCEEPNSGKSHIFDKISDCEINLLDITRFEANRH